MDKRSSNFIPIILLAWYMYSASGENNQARL